MHLILMNPFFCSEEVAREKMYSVSTKHYFAFGALLSEEVANKLRGNDLNTLSLVYFVSWRSNMFSLTRCGKGPTCSS